MSKESMRQLNFGVAVETTRGTAEDTASMWVPVMSMGFHDEVEKFRDESARGVMPANSGADIARNRASGDVEFYIRDDSMGYFLYNLFGSLSTADDDPEAGVYTHTFTESSTNNRKSLTLFRKDGVVNEKAARGMIDSMTVNAVIDEYVRASLSLRSEAFADDTETPSYTAETRFRPTDITLKVGSSGSSPSGETEISTVESVELNYNRALDEFYAFGSTSPAEIANTKDTVTGSMTLSFEDETYRDYVLDNDKKAMELKMTNTDNTIGSSSNPSLGFTLYEVDFHDHSIDYSTGNVIRETVSFTGHYNNNASKMSDAELVNATSSY